MNDLGPLSPVDPDPDSERFEKRRRWAVAVAGVLVLTSCLYLGYRVMHSSRHPELPFGPGDYEHIVFHSGAAVSTAMQAVYMASSATALHSAIAAVKRMAKSGNAEAAFRLGRYYHLESDSPDYALALKYYRIASDEGNAWATNNLGLLYRDGLGVARSNARAYAYFERAARQNNPWAYINLAEMAFVGRGVPASVRRGLGWLEEGETRHCTLCFIEEAALYHAGAFGVRSDRSKAVAVLRRASILGERRPTLILAELYLLGDGVHQSSAKTFEILKTLSDGGYGQASTLLAELSADSKIRDFLFDSALGGVSQMPPDLTKVFPADPARAIRYWNLATEQGDCQSLIDLSSVYDRGVGVKIDHQRATDDVKRAIVCNPRDSFYWWKLAVRYRDGLGAKRSCGTAEKLLAKSFGRGYGYADAGADLGYIYDKGCGSIARDDDHAFQIYLLCAKLGVPLCENNVGAMIKHGRGVPKADPARGYGWMKLAALNGNRLAEENLTERPFTNAERIAGAAALADIELLLHEDPSDPRMLRKDAWY